MRKVLLFLMFLPLLAIGAMAQVRGTARMTGFVTAADTGKPISGATVTLTLATSATEPIVVKTDSHGRWAALGMTDGQWNVDISAPGYTTARGSAAVSSLQPMPSVHTELAPEIKAEPAAPVVPPIAAEGVSAIKEGEALLKIKAGDTVSDASSVGATTTVTHTVTDAEAKADAKQAAADFEKALPMIDESKPGMVDIKNQVYQVLAQAYYRAGDIPNAIATFEKLDARDPMPNPPDQAHTTREVLLANLYLENGQLDKGRALLDALPPTAITDPTAYINIGILFLNKKDPASAVTYFTKAIALDAKQVDPYYYRGLAEIQLKKNAAAKADFQQVLALAAPDSSEAHDAKQLLAGLK